MFLQSLSPKDRDLILGSRNHETYRNGDYLMLHGDQPRVLIVLKGRFTLVRGSPTGREVIMDVGGAGDIVGELSVIDGRPAPWAVRAVGTVEAVALSADEFQSLLTQHYSIVAAVLARAAARVQDHIERRLEAATRSVESQLCERLLELADGQIPDFDGSVTHHGSTNTTGVGRLDRRVA